MPKENEQLIWEGEAPVEPFFAGHDGSAGATPSREIPGLFGNGSFFHSRPIGLRPISDRDSNMSSDTSNDSDRAAVMSAVPSVDATSQKLTALVERSQKVMAHAWMIRTFVKHSDEVEDFPDLNEMARTIFDVFRAVETQVQDPASYFKVVRKKIGKLKSAAEQFAKDAWHASTHTNFQQAVIAARFLAEQLSEIQKEAESLLPSPVAPPKITMPRSAGGPTDVQE